MGHENNPHEPQDGLLLTSAKILLADPTYQSAGSLRRRSPEHATRAVQQIHRDAVHAQCATATSMGKRKSKVDESALPPDERERRERQRQQLKVALDLRARGEEYINVTKKKRKPLEARRLEKRLARRKKENAAQRREVQKAVKKERSNAPDLVIVPIFWKGEAKQMAKVLSACADVQTAISGMKKKVELDGGHKYTPGQKFAHWEHKGVMLRVEVGPREAERGCCTVARTWKAGEQAHRVQKVAISAEALPAALEEIMALEPPGEEQGDTSAAAQYAAAEAREAAEEAAAAANASGNGKRRGGDDLDDDFARPGGGAAEGGEKADEEDEEEEATTSKPKKKKKKGEALGLGGVSKKSSSKARSMLQAAVKSVSF